MSSSNWLYVHGRDITLPPGGVFTTDWDGSLDSGEAATEHSSMSTAEKEIFFRRGRLLL